MRSRHPARLLARLVCKAITVEPVDHEALIVYLDSQAEKETAAAPAS